MILPSLAAAVFSFYATATGIAKGTPVEFFFAGEGSDRDYETMFLLEGSADDFCKGIEAAGVPRGEAQNPKECLLWPVGCPVTIEPSIDDFILRECAPGSPTNLQVIYTGGTRGRSGRALAADEMPLSVFSLYTLDQSPLLFDGIVEQGNAYGHNLARVTLKKGDRVKFTIRWDGETRPSRMSVRFAPGNLASVLKSIKERSSEGSLVLSVAFAPELSIREAEAVANALSLIDSPKIKINGREKNGFFFRAFLPSIKWLDRKERLVQPFELHLSSGNPCLLFIEEDWTVEGMDPRLTEREISFANAAKYPKTDTCLIYAKKDSTLGEVVKFLPKLPETVHTHYVYGE